MKLYHGTSFEYLEQILKEGIRPRGSKPSNWSKFKSRPDMVYLTTTYPFFFARAVESKLPNEKVVVFEIESNLLDQENFFPDEDFIYQVLQGQYKKEGKKPPSHLHIKRRLEDYQQNWQLSLKGLGNCCYNKTIPSSMIIRYCIVDFSQRKRLAMNIDPSISLLNHRFCGEEYKKMLLWFFGDIPLLPQIERFKLFENTSSIGHKGIEIWKEESASRLGIEIKHILQEVNKNE
jgi:hypothetical protein